MNALNTPWPKGIRALCFMSIVLVVVRIDGRRDTLNAQAAPEGLPDWCASDPPVVVMVPLARGPKSP